MKEQIISIAQHFGNILEAKYTEDFLLFKSEIRLTLAKIPLAEEFQSLLPSTAERDTWRLRLLTIETNDDLFDVRNGSNIAVDYDINKLESYIDEEVCLEYSIFKEKNNGIITIYEYSEFLEYSQNLYVPDFISVYKNHLDNQLILEIWSDDAEQFVTSSIAVIKRGDSMPNLEGKENALLRIDESKAYCQWNNRLSNLLPEDVFVVKRDNTGVLAHLFDQMCLLLSALYVADFSSVDKSGIQLRISGFKMMTVETHSSKMREMAFDVGASLQQWYKIYDWCYAGGYTIDKLCIARNIISLNCIKNECLSLNPSTYDAILSNFKIFEKDNVRQYIKVRNEVSKILLDLQDKVNSTVETFTGDFRKNVVGLGTFFLSVVVVRVVANGKWYGAFSTQIVVLSFIFVFISFVVLCYSRCAIDKKEKLYTKHYDQLQRRYKALLSEEEIKELFEDSNPNKTNTHSNYILWQKKVYTWIWAGALLVISVFLTLVWCYNMFESTKIFNILKTIIECCIKNI